MGLFARWLQMRLHRMGGDFFISYTQATKRLGDGDAAEPSHPGITNIRLFYFGNYFEA
jgi:hypothetical protein